MFMKKRKIIYLVLLVLLGWFLGNKLIIWNQRRARFATFSRTDFSRTSIDLEELVLRDFEKNDFPEILETKFISVDEAKLKDSARGVLVDISGEKRFYPINILVWHDVINDFMSGVPITLTYSPYCESAVVFRASAHDQGLKFRSSGFLYRSNLVFHDTRTESLWIQGLGKAVAGDFNKTSIDLVRNTQVLTFDEIKRNHADAQVLSQDTGFFRNYSYNPYTEYFTNDEIPENAKFENLRFDKKEMMYVVPLEDKSLVFSLKDLPEGKTVKRNFNETVIRAAKLGNEIIVTQDENRVGGYKQLWFCWAGLHEEDGIVWDIKLDLLKEEANEEINSAKVF
jgi:hypothetical protein